MIFVRDTKGTNAMNKRIMFETEEPTVSDKKFDAYINITINKKITEGIMRLQPININETSLENELSSTELIHEDEYEVEGNSLYSILANGKSYRIKNVDLYDALMSLKPVDQRIFLLKEYDGWTDAAIGKLLGISRRTVNSKQRSVKIKIRTFLLKRRYGHEQ